MKYNDVILRMLGLKDMTQRELAERTGLTECTISRYIKGDRIPKVSTFEKIIESMGFKIKIVERNEQ